MAVFRSKFFYLSIVLFSALSFIELNDREQYEKHDRAISSVRQYSQYSCADVIKELFDDVFREELQKFTKEDAISQTYLRSFLKRGQVATLGELNEGFSGRNFTQDFHRLKSKGDIESIDDLFTVLETPKEFRRYFNKETGEFNYVPEEVAELALENGDSKLTTARINFRSGSGPRLSVLGDYISILGREDFSLLVTAEKSEVDKLREILAHYPSSIREKINIFAYDEDLWLKKSIAEQWTDIVASSWTQDASKPLAGGQKTYRQRDGINVSRPADTALISELGSKEEVKVSLSSFDFEGGNIVVGARQVFMGPESIYRLTSDLNISYKKAVETFEKEFAKPVVVVGVPRLDSTGHMFLDQSHFHIDLTMAMVRNRNDMKSETAVVSSPVSLFKHLFDIDVKTLENRAAYAKAIKEKIDDQDFIDQLTQKEKVIVSMLVRTPHKYIIDELLKFQYVEMLLKEQGYRVKEVPFAPPGFFGVEKGVMNDFQEKMLKSMTSTINYTNVIISDDYIIMPDFDSPRLQRAAEDVYRSLGYRNIYRAFHSTEDTFCGHGGIRCSTETFR